MLPSAARQVLAGLGGGEDGVEPVAGGGRADAAVGGPDDGEEGTPEVDAAGKVFSVLLGCAGGEDGGGGGSGGGEVGGEERAGDGGVHGGDEFLLGWMNPPDG